MGVDRVKAGFLSSGECWAPTLATIYHWRSSRLEFWSKKAKPLTPHVNASPRISRDTGLPNSLCEACNFPTDFFSSQLHYTRPGDKDVFLEWKEFPKALIFSRIRYSVREYSLHKYAKTELCKLTGV